VFCGKSRAPETRLHGTPGRRHCAARIARGSPIQPFRSFGPPGTALYDIIYDLETVGDIAVTVSLFLSTDSGATYPDTCQAVTGDVGTGVLPGSGKQIVRDAGADFPGLSSPTCRLRVTADDGQIDIPAGFVAIPPGNRVCRPAGAKPVRLQ
jgi:hypothetical protein